MQSLRITCSLTNSQIVKKSIYVPDYKATVAKKSQNNWVFLKHLCPISA